MMGSDYRPLEADLFAEAVASEQSLDWLSDQLATQERPPILDPALIKRIWRTLKHNSQLTQDAEPLEDSSICCPVN